MIETTLLILRREDEIMLAKKKRGFGVGKLNGVGGKIQSGETPEQAMIRECQEEIGVTPSCYEAMGTNSFTEYIDGQRKRLMFHLYVASMWEGEPTETDEMAPGWFHVDSIPYEQMFEADRYWLPAVLQGKKVAGEFEFDINWMLTSWKVEMTNE